jgi:hypothetical protein
MAAIGIAPAAVPQPPPEQSMQANSIPERLRIVRERFGTEESQDIKRDRPTVRFTQWYKGR